MAFTTKNWQNTPSTSTPITAEALEDLEARLSDYTDDSAGVGPPGPAGPANLFVQETMPSSPPVGSLWIPTNPDGSAKPTDQWQVFTAP